jgi:hypothetical protein
MKKNFLTAGLLCCSLWVFAQNVNPQVLDLQDHTGLLSLLFDSKLFDPSGEVLWRPLNFSDALSANYSDDGYLHTHLDTLLYFTTYGISQAVAVFSTLHYEKGELSDCHACGVQISVAVFDEAQGGKWSLGRFAKHFTTLGSGGENGMVGLTQFGSNQWCLTLSMSWIGQGVFSEYASFYNLDNMEKVFNYVVHEDNSGALGAATDESYSYDKSIHFITHEETESGWWDFEIVTRGTQPGIGDDVKSVPANGVERYHFNWETDYYMRVCP